MVTMPNANRIHIAVVGSRNAGKSSLINAITGQAVSLVSDIRGTTTDPVYKAMELLPVGPVVFIDTAGIDDEGELGKLRVDKTMNTLKKVNIAIFVLDGKEEFSEEEKAFLNLLKTRSISCIGVLNKLDQVHNIEEKLQSLKQSTDMEFIPVSVQEGKNIHLVKEALIQLCEKYSKENNILKGIVNPKDVVVLVMPIDEAAPKGRLILPQQQVLRSILDNHGVAISVQLEELTEVIQSLNKIDLVITDSQVLKEVNQIVPEHIKLTAFSIIFSKVKGELKEMLENINAVKNLKPNANILIAEACTHHKQKNDIGTVKIPNWLRNYIGDDLKFTHATGGDFHKDLQQYDLIVHCGGCMITDSEMHYRLEQAKKANVAIVNYGMIIGLMNGVLDRAIKPLL